MKDRLLPSYNYAVHKITLRESLDIAYVDEGPPDSPPLLMIHGWGGNLKHWTLTIEELSQCFRCIAIDLPGYGHSTSTLFAAKDYLAFFSHVVEEFVSRMSLREVYLMGHSMGGQIAIISALKNPPWLNQLILAAPAGFEVFSDEEASRMLEVSNAASIQRQSADQIKKAFGQSFFKTSALMEELMNDRLNARFSSSFETYTQVREAGLRGMLGHKVRSRLSEIRVPTTVIFGAEDELIPNQTLHPELTVGEIASITHEIAHAELVMLSKAGHMLQVDQHAEFNELIKNLMKRKSEINI